MQVQACRHHYILMRCRHIYVQTCRHKMQTSLLFNAMSSHSHAGLRLSPLNLRSVHFICALHQKWNVRAHVCGTNGPIFGKTASDMWSQLMQWAEGPEGFKDGYVKMKKHYVNDPARLTYLLELFHDDNKALFKQNFHFSNGVLVDVCESLISSVKTWIKGTCTH